MQTQNRPTEITLKTELAEKVMSYLATQPYNEVFLLISEMATAAGVGVAEPPSGDTDNEQA